LTPFENQGIGGRDLYTEIHLMAVHCVAAEHDGLIKKKEITFFLKSLNLSVHSVFAVDAFRYAETLTFYPVTLTFDF